MTPEEIRRRLAAVRRRIRRIQTGDSYGVAPSIIAYNRSRRRRAATANDVSIPPIPPKFVPPKLSKRLPPGSIG